MNNSSPNNSEPILTELHDDVVDIAPPPGGRKPIWTDEVDELFEFTDEPSAEVGRVVAPTE